MGKKRNFQQELERMALGQLAVIILLGCLLFCVAMIGIVVEKKQESRKGHLDAVTEAVEDICKAATGFLEDEESQKLFASSVRGEKKGNKLAYQISDFNLNAPVKINLMVTDCGGELVFSSFSGEKDNLHRREFNRISALNARRQNTEIYSTVYYFTRGVSEYVLIRPLYKEDNYIGSAAVYLASEDWRSHLQKYQYDTILTNKERSVIYCSNTGFLQGYKMNRYAPKNSERYLWMNGNRYFISERYLGEQGIHIYSFIYAPKSYGYVLLGVFVIIGLGILWTVLFKRLMKRLAEKTSESVKKLVEEIRVIRKQDPEHVIAIDTEDEIEEIAGDINKLMSSIHELNRRNLELAEINNRMEMQNLQAQINPHFIYNTLENIRYLIILDAAKADELIERFTHILRYSINNTKRQVFLREDMEYIEDYLTIQKTRFEEHFQYEVDICEECMDVSVPKLLLQPLIENSLKHGLRRKASIFVDIRGRIEGDYMVLEVADNGPGLPKSTLETIRGLLRLEEVNTSHNGLQNINRRIILEYGRDSGLYVDSSEGMGFVVILKMWIGGQKHV